jgi:hypothetical protein
MSSPQFGAPVSTGRRDPEPRHRPARSRRRPLAHRKCIGVPPTIGCHPHGATDLGASRLVRVACHSMTTTADPACCNSPRSVKPSSTSRSRSGRGGNVCARFWERLSPAALVYVGCLRHHVRADGLHQELEGMDADNDSSTEAERRDLAPTDEFIGEWPGIQERSSLLDGQRETVRSRLRVINQPSVALKRTWLTIFSHLQSRMTVTPRPAAGACCRAHPSAHSSFVNFAPALIPLPPSAIRRSARWLSRRQTRCNGPDPVHLDGRTRVQNRRSVHVPALDGMAGGGS